MSLLGRLLTGELHASTPGPTDDFWYQPVGMMTPAGIRVDAAGAQTSSAWFRGRLILATVLAMLPWPVYRRLPDDGGSEAATSHPLYDLLHNSPNSWQDSFQWRLQKMFHLIDHGNGYDRIVPGPRGFCDQLHPIHPTLVTPEQVAGGRILYHIRDPKTGISKPSTQDDIFHLRGASEDGVTGKGILEYARSSLGTALATESYAARIFSNGTLSGGVIENPGQLDPEAGRRMAQTFVTKPGEWHFPKVLEQGSVWKPNTMTPEDAQMLLSRKHGVDDIARWLGVPRQMLENSDPSFGNAEQFDESFLTYSMGGWLSLFEFAANRQLILAPRTYYTEFTRDAVARGKLIDRWNVHVASVNAGIKSVDEARAKEGLNKRGGKANELREPQNITGKPLVRTKNPLAPPPDDADDDDDDDVAPPKRARAALIAQASAGRLLRKEITAVQKLGVRHAASGDDFAAAVTEFYVKHAELVALTLLMDPAAAQAYCAGQASQVVSGDWVSAVDLWGADSYAAGLAAIALEEAA